MLHEMVLGIGMGQGALLRYQGCEAEQVKRVLSAIMA